MPPGPTLYRLRGTDFAVDRPRDLPRLAAGVAWLTGPAARRVVHAGPGPGARRAEQNWARSAARWLRMRLTITGSENIDPAGTYVVAPLHEGFADALALLHLPLRLRFVARDELAEWPALGAALQSGGHVIVTPEQPRAAYRTMRRAAPQILDAGDSVVVFPQGSLLGIETAFTGGAFALARATNRQLLPVVVTGSHRVWEHPFSPRVRFDQHVHMTVLEPREAPSDVAGVRSLEREMKLLAETGPAEPRRYVPDRDGYWDGYAFEIDPRYPDVHRAIAAHRDAAGT